MPLKSTDINWNDLRAAQREITRWASSNWPDRTDHQALSKLALEEVPELLVHKRESGINGIGPELADCLILLFDLATLWGVDLPQALEEKMAKNYERRWARNPVSGIAQHVVSSQNNSCICDGPAPNIKCPIHGHEDFKL